MLKSSAQQNRSSVGYHHSIPNEPRPRSNAHRLLANRQPRRRPKQPPGSSTRVCLGFVFITFVQQGGASWLKFVQPVLLLVSPRLQERGGGGKITLIVVEAVMASSKPPVGFDMHISPGERRGFGAPAPSLTRASSLHIGRSGGLI